jgi:hypothetical protein
MPSIARTRRHGGNKEKKDAGLHESKTMPEVTPITGSRIYYGDIQPAVVSAGIDPFDSRKPAFVCIDLAKP